MKKLPEMVDLARTPAEQAEDDMPCTPIYPYGTCISLADDELEKLNMDEDVEVGDMFHFHALAKVTSVSRHETEDGKKNRVELQITHMEAEDEDDENEQAEQNIRRSSLYRK